MSGTASSLTLAAGWACPDYRMPRSRWMPGVASTSSHPLSPRQPLVRPRSRRPVKIPVVRLDQELPLPSIGCGSELDCPRSQQFGDGSRGQMDLRGGFGRNRADHCCRILATASTRRSCRSSPLAIPRSLQCLPTAIRLHPTTAAPAEDARPLLSHMIEPLTSSHHPGTLIRLASHHISLPQARRGSSVGGCVPSHRLQVPARRSTQSRTLVPRPCCWSHHGHAVPHA